MNAVNAILILKHIGFDERSLDEIFEGFEGLNMNIAFPKRGLNYNGLKSFGKKRPVYMYSHGGSTVSLSPFDCPFDSGVVGWIWTNSDRLAKSVIKEIDDFLKDDHYALYDEDADGIIRDFGDIVFSGSYADCIKYAKDNGQEIKYFQDSKN